jgi:hypothetical protein
LIQNENGPCALLAIINSILLTVNNESAPQVHELVVLVNSESDIPLEQLLDRLGDIAVTNQQLYALDPEEVQTTLSLLPKLHEGLNINPTFDGSFITSPELSIFKVFQLPLVHGWILDPNDAEHAAVRKYNSYEASQNVLVEAYELENKPVKDYVDQEIIDDSKQIKHFFARSATQLTDYGLQYLKDNLYDASIAIFFRNDHFGTIIKNDNDIYELLTDIGFKNKPSFVWESLLSINGANNSFFTGDFTPLMEDSSNPFEDGTCELSPQEKDDQALARHLQEEEDQRVAKALQKRYEPKKARPANVDNKAKKEKKPKEKKDKKCVIM